MKNFISSVKYPLAIIFWLAVWHIASLIIASPIILVSPVAAFARLFELAADTAFWRSISFSVIRIIFGFILALILGVLLASITSKSKALYILFLPALNIIKSIPVASFTILALMWIVSHNLSVFISFVTVLPIVYFNTYEGIKNTDEKLLQMAKVFEVPVYKTILHIYLPLILPYVISAAASGLGFAFKAGVAAELIGLARNTIGFNLHTARIFLQTADVLAWTIAIVILSYIMEKIFLLGLKKVEKWH